jgi:hypothetical protein
MSENLKSTLRLPSITIRPVDRLFFVGDLFWNWAGASLVWKTIRLDSLPE